VKASKILTLGLALTLYLAPTILAQDLNDLTLIAHYPLLNSPNDTTGYNDPMTLNNAPYQEGGIYCNGQYLGEPAPCTARTPNLDALDFDAFAMSVMFKINEVPDRRRPVIICGRSYRWLHTFTTADSMIGFGNSDFDLTSSTDVQYPFGVWNNLTVTHSKTEGMQRLYLNSVCIDSATLDLDPHNDRMFSITHGGIGRVYKGLMKDLKIYSIGLRQDSLALVALYNSTDGDNWDNKENWLTGPVDSWYGITVDNDRVTVISLGNNNLIGTIPPEIGNLTELGDLVFHNNQITNHLPETLTNLTNLWELVLNGNELSGEIPDFIWDMESLNFLNLQTNNFTGSIPPEIGNLIDLVYLTMAENSLEGPLPSSIGMLTQLATLSLSWNSLSGVLPDGIGNMVNLSTMYIDQNQFEGAIPENFTACTSLLNVHLDNNQFTDLPDLSSFTVLNNLRIQNNQFTFEDIESNIGVPALDFRYSPQDSVGEKIDTLVLVGSNLTLTMDVGGASNQYQWYMDGAPISDATSQDYQMLPVKFENDGVYTCQITNTVATDLTLYSRPINVSTGDLEQDSLALVAIYHATDGDNWLDNTNWLDGPVSTWYGVTVSDDRVTNLDIDNNNLVGVIPQEIGNLNAMSRLYLFINQLSDSIPHEIGNLTQLTHLYLRNNQLSGSIPPEIGNLTQLEYCYISKNQFTGSIPVEMNRWTQLKRLSIAQNQLTGLVLFDPDSLTNLEHLDMDGNQLDVLPDLSSIATLVRLRVQENQFTFEDIEPNIGIVDYVYSPQDSIGQKKDTTLVIGDNLTLSVTVGGNANAYQWMKDEVDISGATNTTFEIPAVALSDSGSYVCKITNTIATELTLYSRPCNVTVLEESGIGNDLNQIPEEFVLSQNYPNPFNPSTKITYALPVDVDVSLTIYDALGREVTTLVHSAQSAGWHTVQFNASQHSSGLYFYILEAGSYKATQKMLLMK